MKQVGGANASAPLAQPPERHQPYGGAQPPYHATPSQYGTSNDAPGKNFLLVTGIICIVGIIGFVLPVLYIVGTNKNKTAMRKIMR